MKSVPDPRVAAVFATFPPDIRARMFEVRQLILDTAAAEGVGTIEETLKWGEPSYLTSESKSGSTIRIGALKSDANHYALHFNCQTDLVERFRTWFPRGLRFEGNRSIVLYSSHTVPTDSLTTCVAAALTYHREKKSRRRPPRRTS